MATHHDTAPRSTDLETAAIHDMVARMKRLRRRVALPVLIAATVLAWFGATAHAVGYWSLFGASSDGSYLVSGFTLTVAGFLCAAPVVAVGAPLYLALRARLRASWREEYRRKPVSDEWPERDGWLERTSRRFG